eukprot:2886358-Rhodomonas_salina.3
MTFFGNARHTKQNEAKGPFLLPTTVTLMGQQAVPEIRTAGRLVATSPGSTIRDVSTGHRLASA